MLDHQLMQITIQEDLTIHTYSLFCLIDLTVENHLHGKSRENPCYL